MKEKLVVIGNGMAGMRTVEELLQGAPNEYDITVFGAEPYGNYNRIMLTPVLYGAKSIDEIMIHDLDWYHKNGITLHCGADKMVVDVDRKERVVIAKDGSRVEYDRLLIATGSKPFIIPIPGKDTEGVMGFRDIADVKTMIAAAKVKKHAVVLGGGLLGLEAGNGLMQLGMEVTIVNLADRLLNLQLDEVAGNLLKKELEQKGLSFRLGTTIKEIISENGHISRVIFADGSELPADILIMAAGVRPNIQLAEKVGLYCEKGIVVNDTMQTFDPRIYAVGECIQHRGDLFGLVAPVYDQAKVCANHLAGHGIAGYKKLAAATKLKVTGVDLFSAGNFLGDETTEVILFQDYRLGVYKKLVVKDNRILGIVMYGDTADSAWYLNLMMKEHDISSIREHLIFGQTPLPEAA